MSRIILLPGFSPSNKQWAYEMQAAFTQRSLMLETLEWNHWSTGSDSFDVQAETKKFLTLVTGESVVCIAKSIGTRFIAEMVRKHSDLFTLEKLVLLGLPEITDSHTQLITESLCPCMIIQNNTDPFLAYSEVDTWVQTANTDIVLKRGDRDDHTYPQFEEILTFITQQ